jgi:chorismate lyase
MIRWSPHTLPRCRRLRRWLEAQGSLSAHLQAASGRFAVQRIRQGGGARHQDERLGPAPSRHVHFREVLLRCDEVPVVCARTVVQAAHVRGPWRPLIGLGSRPLAQLLFHDRHIHRSAMAFARIPKIGPWRRQVAQQWHAATGAALPAGALWARRSSFVKGRSTSPLLLTEVFAPDFALELKAQPSRQLSPRA